MRRSCRARTLVTTAVLALATAALAGCAVAAPVTTETPTTNETAEAPVTAVDHAAGELDEPVDVSVDGGGAGVGVTFREITLAPGGGTGEHCHDGQLIAVVKEGSLTHYAPTHPDGVRVYETGDAIIEGAGYVHEGRNEGDTDVVLWVTYLIPDGDPLAETDLANCEG